MLLLAAVASVVGFCTVQIGTVTHRTRCRIAQDETSAVAVPIGRHQFAPGMLDISLEILTPGNASMRSLTPAGLNSARGELILERNGVCWTGGDKRICLGRDVRRRRHVVGSIPAAYWGAWGAEDASTDSPHIALRVSGVTDDDGRAWTVSSVVDNDGVLTIHGRAIDDRITRGEWTVAIDPAGDLLLLGAPDSLPRHVAQRQSAASVKRAPSNT